MKNITTGWGLTDQKPYIIVMIGLKVNPIKTFRWGPLYPPGLVLNPDHKKYRGRTIYSEL